MKDDSDRNGQVPADAVILVRQFVVQQLRDGQRSEALSFALTFIATEMGLTVTQGRNPLGAVQIVLQGVIAAVSNLRFSGHVDAALGAENTELRDADAVPTGVVIHH